MDFKTKTVEELHRLVSENRQKLQIFRFAMAGSKQKNVKEGKGLRREIARVQTELRKRAIESPRLRRSGFGGQGKSNLER